MRITENFIDPLDDRGNQLQQVSVHLVVDDAGAPYVELHASNMTPRIRVEDLGTLIQMLRALERRSERK